MSSPDALAREVVANAMRKWAGFLDLESPVVRQNRVHVFARNNSSVHQFTR
jgi:hypothetical protein